MPSDVSSIKRILNSKYPAVAILLIISIGVYLNAIPNEFVYDDEDQVLKNLWIKDIRNVPKIFLSDVWAFEEIEGEIPSNYYRPIMHIIYMIDYHIFGLKPWGFHLTNIIFHAGVTLLVFLIASMLINQYRDLNFKSHPEQVGTNLKYQILNPPFIAALLFAAHPIHTEAVAWVGGIPELSFTLFYLLSFYLYINSNKRYTPLNPLSRGENKNKRWGKGFILSVLFFFLAALCKETALTLPILMLAYDYSISRSSVYSSRFTVHSIMKRYLPYIIVAGIYFILRNYAIGGFAPLKSHAQLSNYEYFINIFPLFIKYLEKLILPINLNVSYAFHSISSIFQLKGIIALIFTIGFIVFVYIFRKHNAVFLSLLWIVIPLLPVLYIPALGENTFTERYLYLPSVGFVVLATLAIERIFQLKVLRHTANYVIISILVILTGLYSVGTIKRNYIWRDNYRLWANAVETSPDSSVAHNNLGFAYHNRNLIDKATEHYQIAIKLKPDYHEAHNNLGNVFLNKKLFDKAIEHYEAALKLKPNSPEVHNNLGASFYSKELFDKAIEHYQIALKLRAGYYNAHYNLGNAYFTVGNLDEAIKEYLIAIKLKPDYPELHLDLGNAYSKQGKSKEAIKEYMIALELKANIHKNLGDEYFNQRRFDEAIKEYMFVLKLKSDFVEAHYGLGLVYLEKGLKHKASEEFETALKLRPDFSPAKKALESIKRER